jgi:hypothetical protein
MYMLSWLIRASRSSGREIHAGGIRCCLTVGFDKPSLNSFST